VSFAVLFRRELPAGTCVGVSLPTGDGFALPVDLHPDEAALVHAAPVLLRTTFIGGRVALRAAMAAVGAGPAESAAPVLRTPRGAPAVPSGFVASISHKREIAVALAARAELTPRTTIGVDVEIPRSLRTNIAPRVLTADEQATLADLDPAARDAELLFRFAAKEAIYKALDPWVQRMVAFQEVEIVTAPDGGRRARLLLAGHQDEGPFDVELHDASDDRLVLVVASVTPKKK
jgi:phosphopantetheine--protein transferase-like protein